MFFDGAKSNVGGGTRVILQDPNGLVHTFSYRLNFKCTNKTFKYEVLVLKFLNSIDMKVNILQGKGDSKLIINQVREQCAMKNPRLKIYRRRVWNLLKNFIAFSINYIPREENLLPNSLDMTASLMEITVPSPL